MNTEPAPRGTDDERARAVRKYARGRAADEFRNTDSAISEVNTIALASDTLPIHRVLHTATTAAVHGYLAMMWRELARTGDVAAAERNARAGDPDRLPHYAGDGPRDVGPALNTFETVVHRQAVADFHEQLTNEFGTDGWPVRS